MPKADAIPKATDERNERRGRDHVCVDDPGERSGCQ